jgi:hypothetical protein
VTALRKDVLRVRFLKIVASDLGARNLRGDGENRNTTAMAVIEAIDQMEIAGAATPRAHRQISGQMRFSASCKSGSFFVSYMDPLEIVAGVNRIRDAVEGVAGQSVDSPHSRICEYVDEQFSHILRHWSILHSAFTEQSSFTFVGTSDPVRRPVVLSPSF